MLTMTNDNDTASKFKVTIRILFVFGRIVKTLYSVQPCTSNCYRNLKDWNISTVKEYERNAHLYTEDPVTITL